MFGAATSFQAAFQVFLYIFDNPTQYAEVYAQAFKKDDSCIGAAVECLTQAIDLHINNGRFSQANDFSGTWLLCRSSRPDR